MHQMVVSDIAPALIVSYKVTTHTSKPASSTIKSLVYPVDVLQDRVRIYGELMALNTYYPFQYKGKKYLALRPKEKVTEVYKVVE